MSSASCRLLLQFLIEYGKSELAAGNTIFGGAISRRDLTHFRHFICGAGTLSVKLARQFSEMFGFTLAAWLRLE